MCTISRQIRDVPKTVESRRFRGDSAGFAALATYNTTAHHLAPVLQEVVITVPPRSPAHRWLAPILGAGLLLWTIAALALVPWIIRSAYAEKSLPFLNALLAGRSVHPVDRYLDAWRNVALKTSLGLVAACVLTFLCVRHWKRISAAFSGRDWRTTSLGAALPVAVWLGWWTGLSNVAYRLRGVGTGSPTQPQIEEVWMAPLLGAVLAGVLGWIVWTLVRRMRGEQTLHAVAGVGLAFFLYSWLRLFGLTIHPLAAMILALGMASQLSRPLVTAGDGFVRLVRRTLPWLAAATVVTAVALAASESLSERGAQRRLGPAPEGAKNVLFLILDTARAKSMSLYGWKRLTTPNIDRLAEGGTVFDFAVAPTSWTLPSHATFFTGLQPQNHGANWAIPLAEEHVTLAEIFGDQGYVTGAFIGNETYATRASGLGQGFQRYEDSSASWLRILRSLPFVAAPIRTVRDWTGRHWTVTRKDAEEVNTQLLDWLDETAETNRPFFAFANYFDVHASFIPRPPFDSLFAPPGGRYWLGDWVQRPDISADEMQQLEISYDRAFAYLDHQIGVLIEELDRRGRLDNTVIVLTSDHGEQFGEHGMINHGNSLYIPSLRVPLVLIDPSGAVPAGGRIAARASLHHLAATILDLAAVPAELPGESLARHWSEEVMDEPILTQVDARSPWWTRRGVIDGPLYYVRNFGGEVPEELYDLDADPEELDNLAVSSQFEGLATELPRMRALLDSLDTGPRAGDLTPTMSTVGGPSVR